MEKHKKNRGITLIALAITIIILLILTAVTISSVTGNGILFQAHKSTNESNKAEEKNILSASVVYAKSTDNMGNVTKENLQKELDKRADEKYNITEVNNEDGTVYEITFKETKNTYVVTEDGTVKEKDEYDGNTTLDINPKTIPNLKVDGTYEISISGGILNSSNKTINWTSTDENTVSILGDKENTTRVTIRGNAVGSAVIQAKVEVKNNKNVVEKSKTVTCNVNVKERNIVINSVTLTADNTTIDLGTGSNSLQVVARTKQGKEIEATDLIWKSSNSKIATVNENGTVTGLTNGTTIITATSDTGINGNITITVQTSPKEIKLSKTTVNFDMSGTHTDKLTVTFNPSTTNANNTLTWESNKSGVVSVDNSGNITGISNGDAVITVKTPNGKSATCNVTVKTSPQSISLNKGNTTLDLNGTKTEKLTVTFNPSSTNTNNGLTWRSDNTGIVSVDTSGNITAKSNGTTTITVTTTNGKKATCSVTVKTSPQSISLNNSSLTLDISGTKTSKLNVNFNPTSSNTNNSITWNSDAPGIATVDSSGNVTGVANGTTTIRATTTNGKVATCSVTVQTSPQSISLNKTNVTLDLVGTQNTDLKVTYNPTTSNVQTSITWTSSNPNVASVDSSGNVMGKANGAAVITAETANGKKTTCNVTVHTSLQSISLNKNKLAFDLSTSHKSEKLQITYSPSSANYNNSVTWKSSNTNVARVDQSGTVTAVGNGGATITATAQNGYTAQCSVGVSTSIISLSVSPTSKTLNIGETVQLTGTKNPTSASEGTQWTSSNTGVATVSGSGLVTAKAAGTATITFKNSSSTKSASCTITVIQKYSSSEINSSFYGKLVSNYHGPNDNGMKYRIFYADGTNVYLIADDYVHKNYVPEEYEWDRGYNSIVIPGNDNGGTSYMIYCDAYQQDTERYIYGGSTFAYYIGSSSKWGTFYKSDFADSATGGPTIKQYLDSYNQTHNTNITFEKDLFTKWSGTYSAFNNGKAYYNLPVQEDFNGIYLKLNTSKANGMILASYMYPQDSLEALRGHYIIVLDSNFGLNNNLTERSGYGCRPLIKLKSNLKFQKNSDESYTISY